jgi:Type VI secretion system/phage-baseplate injector OB domain
MTLGFTYAGTVESNLDPLKLGRLKVRVPHVYGTTTAGVGFIGTNDLPWALPAGLPAGGTPDSGGFSQLPEPGDPVWVRFLDGEPEKPIWEWGMQTNSDAEALLLHQYGAGTPVGPPDRAIWTRYSHAIEFKAAQLTTTTDEGQQLLLQTSESTNGSMVSLQTPSGQSLTLNDETLNVVLQALEAAVVSASTVILNAPTSTLIKTERFTVMVGTSILTMQGDTITITTAAGASIICDADGNIAIGSAGGSALSLENTLVQLAEPTGTGVVFEEGKGSVNTPQLSINATAIVVNTPTGPIHLLPLLMEWLATHTHSNGNEGEPTGPPITSPYV